VVSLPWPTSASALCVYHLPENLRLGGGSQKYSAASAGRKTQREGKLSGRQKSAGEIPSRRGEIIAIVTVIELGFIGIIIIIIIITSTFITIITTPSRYKILG
jgi:cell division protein FtsW (lipid II flippase)